MGEVVELEILYLLDVDRTLFRSGDFALALHDALLGLVDDDDLPSREQVVRDIQAESLPFATYYHHNGVQLKTLYTAAKALDDTYVYDDIGVVDELPGRVILYTKGERCTQELKLHHSSLSKLSEGSTAFDETSQPGVWIVQTNKGELLKRAIDQNASNANMIVLRWNDVEYRTKLLVFVDDKYAEIKPLVGLARSGIPLFLAHIVRDDSKYGASEDRDESAVVEINTLRDLEVKLHELRQKRIRN